MDRSRDLQFPGSVRWRAVDLKPSMSLKSALAFLCLVAAVPVVSRASVITFEAGVNAGAIRPTATYTEAGFTLTGSAAIFSPEMPPFTSLFPGDNTAFYTAAGATLTGPAPFNLISVVMGHTTYPYGPGSEDITITGNLIGGGTVSTTFYNLSSATEETLNFTNLQSATFSGTVSSAFDDIVVISTIPEPASMLLAAVSLLLATLYRISVGCWRKKRC